jgi:hypothetical protein
MGMGKSGCKGPHSPFRPPQPERRMNGFFGGRSASARMVASDVRRALSCVPSEPDRCRFAPLRHQVQPTGGAFGRRRFSFPRFLERPARLV